MSSYLLKKDNLLIQLTCVVSGYCGIPKHWVYVLDICTFNVSFGYNQYDIMWQSWIFELQVQMGAYSFHLCNSLHTIWVDQWHKRNTCPQGQTWLQINDSNNTITVISILMFTFLCLDGSEGFSTIGCPSCCELYWFQINVILLHDQHNLYGSDTHWQPSFDIKTRIHTKTSTYMCVYTHTNTTDFFSVIKFTHKVLASQRLY